MGYSIKLSGDISFSAKTVVAEDSSGTYYNVGDYLTNLMNHSAALMDILYPVGSIFITNNPSNLPLISGKWTQWGQGRTIVGAPSTYYAEVTGGEYQHKLSVAELPAHTHGLTFRKNPNYKGDNSWDYAAGEEESSRTTTSTGGDGAHNNIQPSVAYYYYKRTS